MTQEDKELLLKDLSGRLPYGVMCNIGLKYPLQLQRIFVDKLDGILLDFYEDGNDYQVYLSEVKPYLRPLSSMTGEEKEKLKNISDADEVTSNSICYLEGDTLEDYMSEIPFILCYNIVAWLLENHFDFMGLIPRGLAIEVTPDNNPYK